MEKTLPLSLKWWGFILLPILIALSVALYIVDINTTFGPPLLFQVLSTIFSTGCGLIIAYFAIRTFILTSTWRILFLGGGALAWGIASLLAGWLLTGSFNLAVTVSNFGVLLAATLHLLGAIQNSNENIEANEPKKLSSGAIAVLFCSGITAFFILISIAASNGLFPAFYVSGEGYTLIRYIFSAFYVVFLIVAAALYARLYVFSKSDFVYWYSLGLAMIALGLVAGFLGTPGDPLNWLGRIAQYTGSIYFVVAVVVTRNEARNKQKPVSQMLSEILTQTQAKLRESEQRWATTLSSIGDAVIATDTAGRITFMNPVAEKMTGWNLQEAANKPVTEVFNIINEQTRQKVVDPAEKVLQSGMIVGLANHTVLVRKDGTEVPIDDSGAPIQGAEGKITGVVLVFRDITERKKIERELIESEQQSKSMAENIPSVLMRYDRNCRVVYLSHASEAITGIPVKEFIGKTNREVGMPENLCLLWEDAIQEVFQTGQNKSLEFDLPSDQGVRTFYLKFAPEFDSEGRIAHVLGISTEITERKQTEEALLETQRWINVAQQAAKAGFWSWDMLSQKLTWTKEFYELFGLSPEAPASFETWLNVMSPDDRDPAMTKVNDSIQQHIPLLNEYRITLPDGTIRWIGAWGSTIYDDNSQPRVMTGICLDITESKKAEERIQEQLHMMEQAQILVRDMDGQITFWNEGSEKFYGYSKEEAVGKISHQLLKTIFPRPLPEIEREFSQKGKWEGELIHTRKDGTIVTVSSSWTSYQVNNSYSPTIIEANNDITELKKAEEALRKYTAELEAANKELESYSYSISHDLRTPLRTLDGFSEMVIEEYGDKLDETGKNYLNRIRKASQTMSQLTEDILKLSRITRAEMHKGRVNLSEMTASIADELKASQPERQAEFIIAPDIVVNGDKALLEILLRNLLENSWKYTGKCPDTRIEVGANRQDGKIVYSIKDNGVGFDMKYYDKLFQPFQRLHTSKDYPGTGIGLATAARVIHRHSGKIWTESEIGKGAIFYFTLGE